MPQVSTRMQPDVLIDVTDEEHAVLHACGLLAETAPVVPEAAPTPPVPAKAGRPAEQPAARATAPSPPADAATDGATTTKKG